MPFRHEHFTRNAKAAAALPNLCQEVPRLLELLSPGALGLLMATSSQLRSIVRPEVTGISLKKSGLPTNFAFVTEAGWSRLKKLRITDCCITQKAIQQIIDAHWPHLTSLDLSKSYLHPAAKRCMAQFYWPQLSHLDLSHTRLGSAGLAALVKGNLSQLRTLLLAQNNLGHQAVSHLPHANWPELEVLCLVYNELNKYPDTPDQLFAIEDEGHAAMSAIVKCNWPKLKDLNIGSAAIGPAAINVLSTGQWPNLEALALDDNDMQDMAALVQAKWPHLKNLSFGLGELSKGSVKDLTRCDLSELETLDLSHCFLPKDLAAFSDAHWPCLKTLLLYGVSYDIPETTELAHMLVRAKWPLLETLDIQSCELDSEGLNLLNTCCWSSLCFLRFTTCVDEKEATKLCQQTWPQLIFSLIRSSWIEGAHDVVLSASKIDHSRYD